MKCRFKCFTATNLTTVILCFQGGFAKKPLLFLKMGGTGKSCGKVEQMFAFLEKLW
jgi:hypothetical protein